MGVKPVESNGVVVSSFENSGPGSENRTRFLGPGLVGVFADKIFGWFNCAVTAFTQ